MGSGDYFWFWGSVDLELFLFAEVVDEISEVEIVEAFVRAGSDCHVFPIYRGGVGEFGGAEEVSGGEG